ncbi:MAG: hypothetical protein IIY74_04700, partial [Firmicutes bacterium]|nr:hypothetical protein [Bacillota bacterium]
LDYPGNGSDQVPDKFIGNYDFYLEKSAQVRDALLRNAAAEARGMTYAELDQADQAKKTAQAAPLTESAADWKKRKEEQARKRKAQTALKRCEERIALLEEEAASLDEDLARPGVGTDLAELTRITTRRDQVQQDLEALYEEWEVLSEAQEE